MCLFWGLLEDYIGKIFYVCTKMQIALIFAVLPSHSKQETDQTKLNILAFAIASKAVKDI